MKKLIAIGIACLVSGNALADIIGTYQCHALDPATGKTYESVLKISQKSDVYNMEWSFNDNKKTNATALLAKDKSAKVISGVYVSEREATTPTTLPDKHFGLIQYVVKADKKSTKLTGNWIFAGTTDTGSETCQKTG